MKKLVSIFLSAVIICGLLLISACDRTEDVRKSDGKISVVTTIFPYYDFVRQLAGDKADIRIGVAPAAGAPLTTWFAAPAEPDFPRVLHHRRP